MSGHQTVTESLRAAHRAGDIPRMILFACILNQRYERERRERTAALTAEGFWK